MDIGVVNKYERWFISDTHFRHENIIRFCNRPFSNAKEMDAFMIDRWRTLVKPQNHIYHLGDWTMERGSSAAKRWFIELVRSLPGHKRTLLGNHDHFPTKVYLEAGIEKVYGTWRTDEALLLSHYPVHPSSIGRAKANIHGHIHQNASPKPAIFDGYTTAWNEDSAHLKGTVTPYVNISVEQTNYEPITLDDVLARISRAIKEYENGILDASTGH